MCTTLFLSSRMIAFVGIPVIFVVLVDIHYLLTVLQDFGFILEFTL